jgi:hypothetical protein
MRIGDIMLVKRQVSLSGQKGQCLSGSQIPLINSCMSDDVYWLELKKAECLLSAPNSTWEHAQIHFMYQVASWEERLRLLKKQQLEKHIGV